MFEFPDEALNSYLLDFYKHGQRDALVEYNGIKDDDVWQLLNDFDLCVRALLAAMQRRVMTSSEFVVYADANVLQTFENISRRFKESLKATAA